MAYIHPLKTIMLTHEIYGPMGTVWVFGKDQNPFVLWLDRELFGFLTTIRTHLFYGPPGDCFYISVLGI
jgi:hypothetical protein